MMINITSQYIGKKLKEFNSSLLFNIKVSYRDEVFIRYIDQSCSYNSKIIFTNYSKYITDDFEDLSELIIFDIRLLKYKLPNKNPILDPIEIKNYFITVIHPEEYDKYPILKELQID